jgi:diaminohydroxyphosphoribosylaminopyrimidine deaminase/5-amino-6-(5-phosphoribosylamino)uracil reductase
MGLPGLRPGFPRGCLPAGIFVVTLRAESNVSRARREPSVEETGAAEARAMRQAIRLARRGVGSTHPNPRVGAVILRGAKTVATGFHLRCGSAHAENRAIEQAGELATGATLVVTLEPCAHFGRTPPCVDAIVRSGIRRVVVGMRDPNPLVDGRGIARLRSEGIEVDVGLLESECRSLNPPYLKQLRTGLPWVTLKAMLSLDGRMASESGESRGLGGDAEQRLVHRLRAESDAVLVGVGTVLADDPLLTVRLARGSTPLRVVLDSSLRTPPTARLLASASRFPVVIATTSGNRAAIRTLEDAGAAVWSFEPSGEGRVPLAPLLRRLAAEGRYAILVEGGSTVHTSFLKQNLADRVAIGVAPIILGGASAASLARDLGRPRLAHGIPIDRLEVRRLGEDLWIEGNILPGGDLDV